jgi:hypothetical protein
VASQKNAPRLAAGGECSDAPINGYLTAIDNLKTTLTQQKVY